MLPSGSLRLCTMLTIVPTWKISLGLGSSMLASCWVARKIFLSLARASSNARTLDSRPTTNGVIMYGKMTTSRMGIMGSFLVSNFSRWVTNNRLITPGRKAAPRWRVRNWLCNQVLRAPQRSHNPGNQRISREASQQTLRRTCNSSRDSRREQSEQEWDISEISSAIPLVILDAPARNSIPAAGPTPVFPQHPTDDYLVTP